MVDNMRFHLCSIDRDCVEWQRKYDVWMDGPFEYLERNYVINTIEMFYNKFQKYQTFFRNKIKKDNLEDPVCKFEASRN